MNHSQTKFIAEGGSPSQEDKILDFLQNHIGEWVSMYQLYLISGSMAIHSRCASLRKRGINIVNRTENSKITKQRLSYYMLTQP